MLTSRHRHAKHMASDTQVCRGEEYRLQGRASMDIKHCMAEIFCQ